MKQKNISTKILAEIAIFAALGLVLDLLSSGIFKGVWVNGGSISIAMIPVFIICYRRGLLPGLLCGFILSIIQLVQAPYVISGANYSGAMKVLAPFFQVMLDYVLGYTVCGFAGLFSKPYKNAETKKQKLIWIIIGCMIGGLLKFLVHFIAGWLFWLGDGSAGFMGVDNSTWVYSFIYNGTNCIPNAIICTLLMMLLASKYEFFLIPKDEYRRDITEKRTVKNIVIKTSLMVICIGLITFSSIKLFQSYYSYENDDMVHEKITLNDEELVNNYIKDTYEIELHSSDKLIIDLADGYDYTCIQKITIGEEEITFGSNGNYLEYSNISFAEETNDDTWADYYTAFYDKIEITVAEDAKVVITNYIGGSGYELNYDYLIAILAFLVILFYSIYTLIIEKASTYKFTCIIFGISNFLIVAHALGTFFKALNKASSDNPFDFNYYSRYLFVSIAITIVYIGVVLITYYLMKQFNKQNNNEFVIDNKEEHLIENENKEENVEETKALN